RWATTTPRGSCNWRSASSSTTGARWSRWAIRVPGAASVLRVRTTPGRLDPGALTLGVQAAPPRPVRRAGRAPRGRRGEGAPERRRESLACGAAVASLRPVLGGGDAEDCTREGGGQPVECHGALALGQCGRRGQIEAQLHPRVGSVDALAAGTRGAGEPFDEFGCRDQESVRKPGAGRHAEIVHVSSVP